MFRILLVALAIIILYKLIFGFIIPVYRTSRDIKRKFREMNREMQDRMNAFNQSEAPPQQPSQSKPQTSKDYIDFEEIK